MDMSETHIVKTYANRGIALESGKGMYLFDGVGKKYLDLMSNYGVTIFGHSQPKITRKLQKQLSKLVTLHGSFGNELRQQSAYKLIELCGHGLTQVYFANSGAEAIEAALKFAAVASGKKKFIACNEGYHGKTLGALSATGETKYRRDFEPLIWDFTHILYNNPDHLEQSIDADTAAFIVEPIQGEGGLIVPSGNYLQKIRKICDNYGILLILDEIQTGSGRTGQFLASHSSDIEYDIVCLGKGLAGGIPIGATLVSEAVGEKITKGVQTATFGGNPLAMAGISATLDMFTPTLYKHIQKMGDYFKKSLKRISSPLIKDVRGAGLMIGIEVKDKRNDILKELQKQYILAIPAGENVVRFLPPYIIEKNHIDKTIQALKKILI